jgi:putative flippase GtrA
MPIQTKIKKYTQNTLHRYIVVGGIVYLIEVVVILTSQKLGASPVTAVGISFWTGLVFSFLLTKLVTFSDRQKSIKVVSKQIISFIVLVLFNFIFTLLVAEILKGVFPAVINRTIALIISTSWNYFLYKRAHIYKRYRDYLMPTQKASAKKPDTDNNMSTNLLAGKALKIFASLLPAGQCSFLDYIRR